jgi:MinD superfamily P-loop ATPase
MKRGFTDYAKIPVASSNGTTIAGFSDFRNIIPVFVSESIFGQNGTAISAHKSNIVIPVACKAKRLFVILDTPPGAGKTVTVQLSVNNSASLLSVSITGAGTTTGNDLINVISLNPGDLIRFQYIQTTAGVSAVITAGMEIDIN